MCTSSLARQPGTNDDVEKCQTPSSLCQALQEILIHPFTVCAVTHLCSNCQLVALCLGCFLAELGMAHSNASRVKNLGNKKSGQLWHQHSIQGSRVEAKPVRSFDYNQLEGQSLQVHHEVILGTQEYYALDMETVFTNNFDWSGLTAD